MLLGLRMLTALSYKYMGKTITQQLQNQINSVYIGKVIAQQLQNQTNNKQHL